MQNGLSAGKLWAGGSWHHYYRSDAGFTLWAGASEPTGPYRNVEEIIGALSRIMGVGRADILDTVQYFVLLERRFPEGEDVICLRVRDFPPPPFNTRAFVVFHSLRFGFGVDAVIVRVGETGVVRCRKEFRRLVESHCDWLDEHHNPAVQNQKRVPLTIEIVPVKPVVVMEPPLWARSIRVPRLTRTRTKPAAA